MHKERDKMKKPRKKEEAYLGCAKCGEVVLTLQDRNYNKDLPKGWTRQSIDYHTTFCYCKKCSQATGGGEVTEKQMSKEKDLREILEETFDMVKKGWEDTALTTAKIRIEELFALPKELKKDLTFLCDTSGVNPVFANEIGRRWLSRLTFEEGEDAE